MQLLHMSQEIKRLKGEPRGEGGEKRLVIGCWSYHKSRATDLVPLHLTHLHTCCFLFAKLPCAFLAGQRYLLVIPILNRFRLSEGHEYVRVECHGRRPFTRPQLDPEEADLVSRKDACRNLSSRYMALLPLLIWPKPGGVIRVMATVTGSL